MSAPPATPDFKALFESAPGLYLVLDPELRIVAMSDAYARATMTRREEILGRGVFEIFPDNPDTPLAHAVQNSTASFQRVLFHRTPDAMPVQRQDVRRPEAEGGGFEERYWMPFNSPILAADGSVAWIIHRVEDVTESVRRKAAGLEQTRLNESLRDSRRAALNLMEDAIAARQQAEQASAALRKSEERLAHALDAASDGLWDWNIQTGEVYYSPQWIRLLGYLPEEVPPSVEFWKSIVHPDDMARMMAAIQAHLDGHTPVYECENRLRMKSGDYRWNLDRGRVVERDADGAPVRMVGTDADITPRKQAEEALRARETQLHSFVQQAPVAMAMFDQKMICLAASQRWTKIYGRSQRDLVGLCHYDVHRDLPERWKEIHRKGLDGEHVSNDEDLWVQADGNKLWLRWSVNPWLDVRGKIGGIMIVSEDVTERKRIEEALRDSEQRYRALVEASPDAIFVLKHGRIEFINLEGARLLGAKSTRQVLGRSPFDFFRRSRHEIIRQRIDRLSHSGGASPLVEEELVRLDGSTRWVTLNSAMFTEDGETAVQVILHDITERRRLETELLEIADREQQRIGHDLHDGLGQQLTGLEMRSFLLLEALAADKPAGRRKQLEEHARQISQGLRDCVRTTRSISHGLAPVALKSGGLTGALEQLAHRARVPGKIECRLICHKPMTVEDAQIAKHLYRIAQEAVNNALKHARTQRIEISLTDERGTLRLQIKDDGRGLPTSRRRRAGMGLEIMRHRAQVIGAILDIDSKPGQGVTVTCTFPLSKP